MEVTFLKQNTLQIKKNKKKINKASLSLFRDCIPSPLSAKEGLDNNQKIFERMLQVKIVMIWLVCILLTASLKME